MNLQVTAAVGRCDYQPRPMTAR